MARKVYISYSRRSDYSFIQALIKATQKASSKNSFELQSLVVKESESASITTLEEQKPDNIDLDSWDVIYDEIGLEAGGSINAFMQELSEAEKIIILLSPGYFESPYCLTELLLIYFKRAQELIPSVVFVDGYSPNNLTIKAVLDNLKTQRDKKEKEGKTQIARNYQEFIEKLPIVLSWLLGRYVDGKEGWDTFSLVFAQIDTATPCKVVASLDEDCIPRFKHWSCKQKQALITDEINKVFSREAFIPHLDAFKSAFLSLVDTHTDLASSLAAPGDANKLNRSLAVLEEWLKEIAANSVPGYALCLFAEQVKELLGWLLLASIDDLKLHQLIHKLNRQRSVASMEIFDENDTSFQMLASAIAAAPVLFVYNATAGEKVLKGSDQLELLDRGCDQSNYTQWLKSEDDWHSIHKGLYRQMSIDPDTGEQLSRKQRTYSSLLGAMEKILMGKRAFYLLFNEKYLEVAKCKEFRKDLGDRFPKIQQIISNDKSPNKAGDYYLQGLNSGYLDEQIFEIYKTLYRLTHDTTANT